MREFSVAEQRYQAVMAVIAEGLTLPRYIINGDESPRPED
jgi:hypothetical protein